MPRAYQAGMDSSARRESDLVMPEGLEAGVLGGLVVVLVYVVPDMMSGDWLRTPARLGAVLFGRAAQETPIASGGLAGAYTFVHFAGWAITGFAASALMRLAERRPDLRRLPPIAFAVWIACMLAFDLWLASADLPVVHLWAGSLVSGAAVGAYLIWRHPDAVAPVPDAADDATGGEPPH
jgi:hypothetical protein